MEPIVSLRVHRVVPKDTERLDFLTPAERQEFFSPVDEQQVPQEELGPEYAGSWQLLPRSYGQVYLGELFSFYVTVTHDSSSSSSSAAASARLPVTELAVRIDLQVTSRVINLCDTSRPALLPQQAVHLLVQHEVKEMGANVLICTVSYKSPESGTASSSDTSSFRKYFKFHVEKPLDVKTKFYNAESDEVYLEALLENLTNLPMRLDSVQLEPSPHFDVSSLNTIADDGEGREGLVFGPVNRFSPSHFRQYLFCLTPKPSVRQDVRLLKTVTVIGKLDIVWTSGVGSRGHLQTSQLERMGPAYSDVRLTVTRIPSTVPIRVPFSLTCRVCNCSDSERELVISFDNQAAGQAILWLGISGQSLGRLDPGAGVDVPLTGYPVKPGLAPVPRIRVTDCNTRADFAYDDAAYVFVTDAEQQISDPCDTRHPT